MKLLKQRTVQIIKVQLLSIISKILFPSPKIPYSIDHRILTAARNGEILANEAEVNVVAGVVKQFFRELPKPLFPVEMYNDFVELLDSQGWKILNSVRKAFPLSFCYQFVSFFILVNQGTFSDF